MKPYKIDFNKRTAKGKRVWQTEEAGRPTNTTEITINWDEADRLAQILRQQTQTPEIQVLRIRMAAAKRQIERDTERWLQEQEWRGGVN